jgi:hypothetical protein
MPLLFYGTLRQARREDYHSIFFLIHMSPGTHPIAVMITGIGMGIFSGGVITG